MILESPSCKSIPCSDPYLHEISSILSSTLRNCASSQIGHNLFWGNHGECHLQMNCLFCVFSDVLSKAFLAAVTSTRTSVTMPLCNVDLPWQAGKSINATPNDGEWTCVP